MLKNNKPFCDLCKREMEIISEEDGEPCGFPHDKAHEHVCSECHEALFDLAWDRRDPCGECETKPCERGRDCWYQPSLGLVYETYFADAIAEEARGK